jgi:UDP-glucose 4-epimerase
MKILVTGGTGYIGSHTAIELINAGHEVVIVDNLANSKITVLDKIESITGTKPKFYQVDLLDKPALEQIFNENTFDAVIHFAGLKAVAESVANPLLYFKTNLESSINLFDCMKAHDVKKLIFSSSATVYGGNSNGECIESFQTGIAITNPYGKTKYMIEEIMKDLSAAWPEFSAIALRYFNPIGNHASGLIGEDPNGIPNNLMPIVMKVAKGEIPELSVYGNDYDTPDGTCRRDYIHVVDLAKGHLAALSVTAPGFKAYNLGTGTPTSVLEIIAAFNAASGNSLPYKIVARRPGDVANLWADPTLAGKELNWHAELTVADAMKDTLKFLSLS